MIEAIGSFQAGFLFGFFSTLVVCGVGVIAVTLNYSHSSRELRYKTSEIESLLSGARHG
jgi:hypothetical protein